MNPEAKAEHDFVATDTAKESAAPQLTRFPSLAPNQFASFFGSISTAC
jgi:hypothetical protein